MAVTIPVDNLNCPVCIDLFKYPKYLSCHHTYCKQCLEKIQVQSIIRCPECRKETTVPKGGVKDLDNNFTMKSLVDQFLSKLYTFVLIGETGSGKTSLIDLFCNCAVLQETRKETDEIDLSKIEKFHDPNLEHPQSKQMESKTFGAKLYHTKLFELEVGVIDTPGFNDTHGLDHDKNNIKSIIETIRDIQHVNCICLVVNGRLSRISPSLEYVLTSITSILPLSGIDNVIVVLTNCSRKSHSSFDIKILESYFGKCIPHEKVFCIENPYCEYTNSKADDKSLISAAAKDIAASFQTTTTVLKSIYEAIKGFKKVNTNEFVKAYEKKEEVELKVIAILTEYERQNNLQKSIKEAERDSEAAVTKKELYQHYRTRKETTFYEIETKERHHTLCGYPGCHSNCHSPCYIDMSFNKEALLECKCLYRSTNCKVCQHPYTYHYHIKGKFVARSKVQDLIDESMKKKFTDAEDMQKQADTLKTEYKKSLNQVQEKKMQLLKELKEVIIEFQKCSVLCNFAKVLESQFKLINYHIKAELKSGTDKSDLEETKNELLKKLDIVKKDLPQSYVAEN